MRRGRAGRLRRKRSRKPGSCDDSEAIFDLLKWIVSHHSLQDGPETRRGEWYCQLQPYNFPTTGRGLRTKRNIVAGEIILLLPLKCLITPQTVLDSDLGPHIVGLDFPLTPQRVLAAFLLHEKHKGSNSAWNRYLQTVPGTFSTPAFLSYAELDHLPAWLRDDALAFRSTVDSVHRDLQELLRRCVGAVTRHDVCWAWSAVNTRCVFLETPASPHWELAAKESNCALAPFLDLLNHDPCAKVEAGANPKTGCYEIRTLDPYRKHEQVFICYGCHGNRKLWLEYGFAVPGNPHSCIDVGFDILKRSHDQMKLQQWRRKLALLQKHSLDRALHCSWDSLSWTLESALRVLVLESDSLEGWSLGRLDTEPSLQEAGRLQRMKTMVLTLMLSARKSAQKVLTESSLSPSLTAALALVEDEIGILQKALGMCGMQD